MVCAQQDGPRAEVAQVREPPLQGSAAQCIGRCPGLYYEGRTAAPFASVLCIPLEYGENDAKTGCR